MLADHNGKEVKWHIPVTEFWLAKMAEVVKAREKEIWEIVEERKIGKFDPGLGTAQQDDGWNAALSSLQSSIKGDNLEKK